MKPPTHLLATSSAVPCLTLSGNPPDNQSIDTIRIFQPEKESPMKSFIQSLAAASSLAVTLAVSPAFARCIGLVDAIRGGDPRRRVGV